MTVILWPGRCSVVEIKANKNKKNYNNLVYIRKWYAHELGYMGICNMQTFDR